MSAARRTWAIATAVILVAGIAGMATSGITFINDFNEKVPPTLSEAAVALVAAGLGTVAGVSLLIFLVTSVTNRRRADR